MRNLLFLLLCMTAGLVGAQDDGYTMYEAIILEPDYENIAELSDALAEHNSTYHNEDPFKALVWDISTGPNAGKMIWMMGPCTFSDLDNRPSGEHDEHWMSKVVVNLEGVSNGEYWKRDDDLSYGGDGNPNPLVIVRYLELADGQGYRLNGLLKRVSDAVKAVDNGDSWSVYYNEFQQGDIGRHVALVSGLDSWAAFDKEDTWVADYEKHHGDGSWQTFMREWNDVVDNSWDEIWTYNAKLSSNDDE